MSVGAGASGARRWIHHSNKVRRACRGRKGGRGRGNRRSPPAGQRQARSRYAMERADGFGCNLAALARSVPWRSRGPSSAMWSLPLCMAAPPVPRTAEAAGSRFRGPGAGRGSSKGNGPQWIAVSRLLSRRAAHDASRGPCSSLVVDAGGRYFRQHEPAGSFHTPASHDGIPSRTRAHRVQIALSWRVRAVQVAQP